MFIRTTAHNVSKLENFRAQLVHYQTQETFRTISETTLLHQLFDILFEIEEDISTLIHMIGSDPHCRSRKHQLQIPALIDYIDIATAIIESPNQNPT